ncbi:uncharacterized protein K460DRAFT_349885 [Cucurbitaria berberidis CBS 394.84]|uniref:Uncharacterized protein n=1 Tax=Cucurbitaria berberidis CBS 394.84 TaxID=1168544 RepID=A0A9P4LBL4_9PLEO|nr:uncharacterized protein K460DRAFT_349885 [Cucurbitaria berberidis CBS 394.84]KAF1849726.1 hypothetical protein K460DRAFT_349885 [Cucurbitaria berberidis CBS 394.84]
MARPYRNNWHPYQNNNNNNNRKGWPKKRGWEEKLHRADDQIAPTLASRSTDDLQRWALVTANMPQQGHRKNETEIIERIQRRYEHPNNQSQTPPAPFQGLHHAPAHHDAFHEPIGKASSPPITPYANAWKRPRSMSPPSSRHSLRNDLSAFGYVQSMKRRRSRSPSPASSLHFPTTKQRHQTGTVAASEVDEDYDYAQSSDWSFPSSDHDAADSR